MLLVIFLFLLFVFFGGISELEAVWGFGDAALGLMTFPNLIAIIALSVGLKKMTKEYFAMKHKTYQEILEEEKRAGRM